MAAVAGYKKVGAPFSNESGYARITYDFTVDGGATGVLDLCEAQGDVIVKSFHAVAKTGVSTSGSPTLMVGISGGDTDAAMTTTIGAAANLDTAGKVVGQAATVPFLLPAGSKLIQTIAAAAYTQGKIEYVLELMKA